MRVDSEELQALDQKGLIPGPNEGADVFIGRVRALLKDLETKPQPKEALELHVQSALNLLESTYGTRPQWPRVSCDQGLSRSLSLGYWEERFGSGQIFLQKELIRGKVWGYSAREVLAHELAHAARSMFPADLFDEYLSYQLSPRWHRRYLGPLLASPALLAFLLANLVIALTTLLITPFEQKGLFADFLFKGLFGIRITLSFWILGRLTQLLLFWRAGRVLERLSPGFGSWWLFRLTQKEALVVGIMGRRAPFKSLGEGLRRQLFRAKLKKFF